MADIMELDNFNLEIQQLSDDLIFWTNEKELREFQINQYTIINSNLIAEKSYLDSAKSSFGSIVGGSAGSWATARIAVIDAEIENNLKIIDIYNLQIPTITARISYLSTKLEKINNY